MRATTKFNERVEQITVDTIGLQKMLSCGRKSAVEIGMAANARISLNKRVLWNVRKIEKFLDTISE